MTRLNHRLAGVGVKAGVLLSQASLFLLLFGGINLDFNVVLDSLQPLFEFDNAFAEASPDFREAAFRRKAARWPLLPSTRPSTAFPAR